AGRFAEEDDIAERQQVKGIFEGRAQPPTPLRQGAHLAQFARPERGDAARLAPGGRPQDQGEGLLGGRGGCPGRGRPRLNPPAPLPGREGGEAPLFASGRGPGRVVVTEPRPGSCSNAGPLWLGWGTREEAA